MKPQRVGKYRQRVSLYDVRETTRDSHGQSSTNGTLIGTYWAEVRPLKGQEQLNVRSMWPTATHLVNMRWLGSDIPTTANNPNRQILPRMYLVDTLDDSQLNIVFANNVEKRNWKWELTCEEKVST